MAWPLEAFIPTSKFDPARTRSWPTFFANSTFPFVGKDCQQAYRLTRIHSNARQYSRDVHVRSTVYFQISPFAVSSAMTLSCESPVSNSLFASNTKPSVASTSADISVQS